MGLSGLVALATVFVRRGILCIQRAREIRVPGGAGVATRWRRATIGENDDLLELTASLSGRLVDILCDSCLITRRYLKSHMTCTGFVRGWFRGLVGRRQADLELDRLALATFGEKDDGVLA